MKINPTTALLSTLIIIFLGIFATAATGVWSTASTKTPMKFETTGEYRADDIRGSYSFGEISSLFSVPLEHLANAFEVPMSEAQSFQCKDLETLFADSSQEIGTGSVRLFVAFYLGQPIDLTESTYITQNAAEIINTYGSPLEEQRKYLETHLITLDSVKQEPPKESTADKKPTEIVYETINIQGSSYLKDIASSYSIPIKDIAEAFLLSSLEADNFQVKDIKTKFSNSDAEIGTSSIKIFIAFYKGIPYDLSQTNAFITKEGAEIIKANGAPLEEQIKYLDSHTAP